MALPSKLINKIQAAINHSCKTVYHLHTHTPTTYHALARLAVVVPAFTTGEDLHSILLMEADFSAAASDAIALWTAVLLLVNIEVHRHVRTVALLCLALDYSL